MAGPDGPVLLFSGFALKMLSQLRATVCFSRKSQWEAKAYGTQSPLHGLTDAEATRPREMGAATRLRRLSPSLPALCPVIGPIEAVDAVTGELLAAESDD